VFGLNTTEKRQIIDKADIESVFAPLPRS